MHIDNGVTESVTNVVQQKLLLSPSSGYVVDVYVPSIISPLSIALTPTLLVSADDHPVLREY